MIRADLDREKLLKELEALRQRVTEFKSVSSGRKRADKQVRESEEKLKTYLENAPDGIYLSDLKGVFLYGNKKAEEILGYKKEELIGNNFLKLKVLPEKYFAKAGQLLALNLIGKNTGPDEFELVKKDKSVCWVEINTSPIKQKGKRIIIGFVRDITDRKQAEKLLYESEAKYRLIVEKSQDVLFTFNIVGEFLYVSPSVKNILGYNPSDLIGHTFGSLAHPEDMPGLQRAIQLNIKNGYQTPGGNRYRVRHANGEWRWHNAAGNAIFDANGNFLYFVAISRDITEHKRAEEALKASEEKYSTLIEQSNDGIIILNGQVIEFVNHRIADISGYPPEEVLGKNFDELISLESQELLSERKRKKQAGEPVPDNYELEIITKGKRKIPVETKIQPITYKGISARMVTIRDITGLKQAENARRESEEKYRLIVENSRDMIFTVDANENYVYISPSMTKMLGYNNTELVGKPFLSLVHPEDRHIIEEETRRSYLPGYKATGDNVYRIRHASGEWRWVLTRGARVVDNKGKFVYFTAIARDITEQKQTGDKLKQLSDRQANLLAAVPDIIMEVDKDKIYTWANQAGLDFFGDEVVGKEATFYFEGEQDTYDTSKPLFGGDEKNICVESWQRRKDGQIRLLAWRCRALKDSFGNVTGALSSAQDITDSKQAEQELKESQNRYRSLVDNANEAIVVAQDGQLKFANLTTFELFKGYSEQELTAKPFTDFVHPDDRARIVENFRKRIHNEPIPQRNKYRIIVPDGSVKWAEIGTTVIEWKGKPATLNFITDITEHRQAEEALRESEEKYRLIVENSSDIIFTLNDKGEFIYLSPSVKKVLGYNQDALIGLSFVSLVHPDDLHVIDEARKQHRIGGGGVVIAVEYRFRHASGKWRWLVSTGTPMRERVENSFNFVGVARDITEKKLAEAKLQQAAQEWRTTFDSITDLISIRNADNRIIRVNKAMADLLNTNPKELVGKFCHEAMHCGKEPPANCPHLLTLKTGKPSSLEIFNPKFGLHFQESASPLFNEKGEITGTVLVARDVTQRKRMEEHLVMTDRLASIGELSSGIAHELNNPLTSVIGFSQLLMEGDVPENIKEDLGTVYSEAQRAAAIVKNLLTFARKHAPVKQLSQVNTVIEDVLRLRAYEQKVNNIEIENRLAPNLPEIMIDHFQMQQVFLNIMVNAEFAMLEAHHKGKLIIATEKTNSVIKITFIDDGPGIDQENLKHIFDPFFTTKEVGKGTGLGLSICHGIVTEHGGQIYATSEKGQGATFVIELPLINEQ